MLRVLVLSAGLVLALLTRVCWASNGWYLLMPSLGPYNEGAEYLRGVRVRDSEPISKWNHLAAYDSAAECETDRNNRIVIEQGIFARATDEYRRLMSSKPEPVALKAQRGIVERQNGLVDALLRSRCVSSEDARLR